jgi:hypothetical protein
VPIDSDPRALAILHEWVKANPEIAISSYPLFDVNRAGAPLQANMAHQE